MAATAATIENVAAATDQPFKPLITKAMKPPTATGNDDKYMKANARG